MRMLWELCQILLLFTHQSRRGRQSPLCKSMLSGKSENTSKKLILLQQINPCLSAGGLSGYFCRFFSTRRHFGPHLHNTKHWKRIYVHSSLTPTHLTFSFRLASDEHWIQNLESNNFALCHRVEIQLCCVMPTADGHLYPSWTFCFANEKSIIATLC